MRSILLACVLVLSACGDNKEGASHDAGADSNTPSDSGIDTPNGNTVTGCDDRSDAIIPRPPSEGIPCELVPPGVTITVAP